MLPRAAVFVAHRGCTKRSLLLHAASTSRSLQASAHLFESVQAAVASDTNSAAAKSDSYSAAASFSGQENEKAHTKSRRKNGAPHKAESASGKHDGSDGHRSGRQRGDRGTRDDRRQPGRGHGGRSEGRGQGRGGRGGGERRGASRLKERAGAPRRGGHAASREPRGTNPERAEARVDAKKMGLKGKPENTVSKEYVDSMTLLGRNGQWFKANLAYKTAKEDPKVEMTVFMFNATIAALAKSGRWSEAIAVLDDMREAGFGMDRYTYNAMIQACVKGGEAKRAFSLYEEMDEDDVKPDAYTYNHLVTGCNDGDWERALDLVEKMDAAKLIVSSVTYNGVIVAFGSAGELDRALHCLEVMRDRSILLTEGTFAAAISACGKAGHWERAVSLLNEMEEDNVLPNSYCYNAAMQACLGADRWPEAVQILRRSLADPDNADRINFKQTLVACARVGEVDLAQELIEELHKAGHPIPQSAINYVQYAERTFMRHGKPTTSSAGVVGAVSLRSDEEDEADWNDIKTGNDGEIKLVKAADENSGVGDGESDIKGANHNSGSAHDAVLSPFEQVNANDAQSAAVEKAATKSRELWTDKDGDGDMAQAEPASANAEINGVATTEETNGTAAAVTEASLSSSLTDTSASPSAKATKKRPQTKWEAPYSSRKFVLCARELMTRGDGRGAVKLLKLAIDDSSVKVTMLMYEAALMAAAKHGHLKESMDVLGYIREAGLVPSSMCLVWAIRACGRAEPVNVPLALALLKQMDPPDTWGYTAALSACANGLMWEKSLELLEEISTAGLRANVHCYCAAMAALAKAKPSRLDDIVRLLDEMKRKEVTPNNVAYDIVIRACLDSGDAEKALSFHAEMRQHDHTSSIDLNRRIAAMKKKVSEAEQA